MEPRPAPPSGSDALRDAAEAADAFGRLAQAELGLALSLLLRVLLALLAALLLVPATLWFGLAGLLALFEQLGVGGAQARLLLAAGCAASILLLLRQSGHWLQEAALPATRRQLRRLLTVVQR